MLNVIKIKTSKLLRDKKLNRAFVGTKKVKCELNWFITSLSIFAEIQPNGSDKWLLFQRNVKIKTG